MIRILIGSPIKREPGILSLFLESLSNLDTEGLSVDYFFYDDNNCLESYSLLKSFNPKVLKRAKDNVNFICNEESHFWVKQNIERVALFKDEIMDYARDNKYDYLFLIDSDVLIYPQTLQHLIRQVKDIIFCVYWTKWKKEDRISLPNVWLQNEYDFFLTHTNKLTKEEKEKAQEKSIEFLKTLLIPGVYQVGGGGACSLLSRRVLESNVRFKEISNLSWLGEDRHFCIRAVCNGFTLWADTYFPPFHCYRESDIPKAKQYLELAKIRVTKSMNNKLTLMMLVRNEADRYLKEVLESVKFCDEFVILDDASTDDTVKICKEILDGKPLKIISNPVSQFNNEIVLRKQLWDMAIETNPDWLLCLDADEMFEKEAQYRIRTLIDQPTYDWYGFRLFDMWDKNHYRDDVYWTAHKRYWITLTRYQPKFQYKWLEQGHHCGRFPYNIDKLPGRGDSLRIKHLGWMREEDRKAKYDRYMRNDPNGVYGIMEQYKSILDDNPKLKLWRE